MGKSNLFIGATGQHVGKTTLSLGILSGLKKRLGSVGFIKPIGQEHVEVEEGLKVDKDAVLFRKVFQLKDSWLDMSPLIIPPGFTRQYLDEKISPAPLKERIAASYEKIWRNYPLTLVEGTGHIGVGSILGMNNAEVANMLDLELILIASGGLGSAVDELALNLEMCRSKGVRVRGVILNRVLQEKREMILDYFPKALKKWGVPLIGCVPYHPFLSTPTMEDFESLFGSELLCGKEHRMRHFQHKRLVACSHQADEQALSSHELIILPVSREDLILETLKRCRKAKEEGIDLKCGLIITGKVEPGRELLQRIRRFDVPVLFAPFYCYEAMTKIASDITKIRKDDVSKISEAIHLVEQHLDFTQLLDREDE